MGILQSINWKW